MDRIIPPLISHLQADSTITDEVSTRIYWEAEQGSDPVWPFITLEKVSSLPYHDLGGSVGVTRTRVEVDAWATEGDTADNIGNLIRLSLDDFRGTIGNAPYTATVLGITLVDDSSEPIKPSDASPTGVHRARLDFEITYTQSTP